MRRIKIISLITAFSILFVSSSVYALSIQELLNRQKQIDKERNAIESKIDKIEKQKDSIEAQIDKINQKISRVQDSLNSINKKLEDNNVKTNSLNKEINNITKKQEQQQKALETRLRVFYENGNTTYLEILLNSTSLADLACRIDLVKQIVTCDKNIIDELESSKKLLDEKKAELEITKKEIMDSKQQYEIVKKEQLDAKSEKNKLMSKLTEEQRKVEREYEILEEESNRIASQIQKAQNGTKNSPYVGGQFNWPVPNYYTITSDFGYRFHPVLKVNKMHSGIDIGASMGANVVAANDGTVISSCYMSGYGNTVIIDHGGGLSTLYAHNSSLLVSSGQKVKKGQSIAKAGSTGISTGPHVHFEVRQNGAVVNPMAYLK